MLSILLLDIEKCIGQRYNATCRYIERIAFKIRLNVTGLRDVRVCDV